MHATLIFDAHVSMMKLIAESIFVALDLKINFTKEIYMAEHFN